LVKQKEEEKSVIDQRKLFLITSFSTLTRAVSGVLLICTNVWPDDLQFYSRLAVSGKKKILMRMEIALFGENSA
jgi:hypothetical protein